MPSRMLKKPASFVARLEKHPQRSLRGYASVLTSAAALLGGLLSILRLHMQIGIRL